MVDEKRRKVWKYFQQIPELITLKTLQAGQKEAISWLQISENPSNHLENSSIGPSKISNAPIKAAISKGHYKHEWSYEDLTIKNWNFSKN